MFLSSDNAGPAHPQILQRVMDANRGFAAPYGDDALMDEVRDRLRTVFEAPQAAVYLVATGTAANALGLACLANPWDTIFCSAVSHIEEDECNAPEFYCGAAKLTLIPTDDKMAPDALRHAIARRDPEDVHIAQRGPVSITQVTERGSVHSLDELEALTSVARAFGLPVHMDGARFANALVALGCTPAEMTWKRGIDVLSFGGTKNGCMGVEAVILFDPARAREFELRRKRGAHLFSKHRYLSAQMAGYLQDDLWLDTARAANANAAYLAEGLRGKGAEFLFAPQANMLFPRFPRRVHQRLRAAGAAYKLIDGPLDSGDPEEMLAARLVCDWSIGRDALDRFLDHF